MPKIGKKKYMHMNVSGKVQAYRVNDYEYDLLEEIRKFEKLETQSETLRFILREAARSRNLHPPTVKVSQSVVK